jgi:two-component system, cell cycle response regulator DivK
MPGMDGLAAVRALRADPATAGIKVLALTALAMKGDAERMLAAGFDAYIAKPFHYKDLLNSVQRLLG